MIRVINKPIGKITGDDILSFLTYMRINGASDSYLNTIRAYLKTFFKFCETKGYVIRDPIIEIPNIKAKKKLKPAFSDDDMAVMRNACVRKRDFALIEFLYSSGVRVSELCGLDIEDVDFESRTAKVLGKGNKERIVYFSEKAKECLEEYINSREDKNTALFVSVNKPYNRLQKSGVESWLKTLSNKCGVADVHPHRFRRTLATNLLNKGMPLEEVQRILGHENMNTTMLYCNLKDDIVQSNYNKLMSG